VEDGTEIECYRGDTISLSLHTPRISTTKHHNITPHKTTSKSYGVDEPSSESSLLPLVVVVVDVVAFVAPGDGVLGIGACVVGACCDRSTSVVVVVVMVLLVFGVGISDVSSHNPAERNNDS
jgi:hypothetical protein